MSLFLCLTYPFPSTFVWFDYQNNIFYSTKPWKSLLCNFVSSCYSLFVRSECSSQYPVIKHPEYLLHLMWQIYTKLKVKYFISGLRICFLPFQILGYTHHQDNIIHSSNLNFRCLPSKPTADLSVSTVVILLIVSSNESLQHYNLRH